jgi:hypothetical protein
MLGFIYPTYILVWLVDRWKRIKPTLPPLSSKKLNKLPVLRMWDVYPRNPDFYPSRIPTDPTTATKRREKNYITK